LFTLTREETVATEIAGEISPQDELVELQSPEKMDKTKLEKLEQDPLFTVTQEIHLQDLSPLLFQWLLFPLELV
jgi:hypothetical protein